MSSDVQVPDGWNKRVVGDFIESIIDFRGRTPKKLGMEWNGGNISALSANNVQMGKVNFAKECYLGSEELYQTWMTKGATQKGDVLLTMEAPLGNVAQVPDDKKYILSQRVVLLKTKKECVNNDFLFQSMMGEKFQHQLHLNSTGTTALGIQQKKLVKLPVLLPPLPEQMKIASILTSVDNVIEKTEAQISKLQDLKKGMMTELLTKGISHTEFKDSPVGRIPVSWEVKKVIDVSENGTSNGLYKLKSFYGSGHEMVHMSDLFSSDEIVSGGKQRVDITKAEHRFMLKEGDLLFGRTSLTLDGVGKCCVVGKLSAPITYESNIMRVRLKNEVYPKFVYYYFLSPYGRKQMSKYARQVAASTITGSDLEGFLLPVPTVDEQRKTAEIISNVDVIINSKSSKLQHTKALKKALMNDLLTGKVRVSITN